MCSKIEIFWKIHINLKKITKLTQMIRNILKIIKFEKLEYFKKFTKFKHKIMVKHLKCFEKIIQGIKFFETIDRTIHKGKISRESRNVILKI